ncbi:hypothetical protein [Corallococcus sp. EGB]|uniref:hypothetical protein n=1 Tax=Corallococcus sp. EGB TaxID=1521117 RepID=UPI001CC0042F|nr:hypothetical protein [Corallococcus sp. EGB]
MGWNELAALGNILGGIGGLAAVALAAWAASSTIPNTIRGFRETKREEKRADIAQQVWVAAFHVVRGIEAVRHPFTMGDGPGESDPLEPSNRDAAEDFLSATREPMENLRTAMNELVKAWPLAVIHLPVGVVEALGDLWDVNADFHSRYSRYLRSLKRRSSHTIQASATWEPGTSLAFHDMELTSNLESIERRLQAQLMPIARHLPL